MDDNEQRQAPEEFEREFFGPNQVGELGTAELDRIAESQATRILRPVVFALLLGLSRRHCSFHFITAILFQFITATNRDSPTQKRSFHARTTANTSAAPCSCLPATS